MNIAIMRAFVRLREMLATPKELARKPEELERKYDAQFKVVFDAIRQLMTPAPAADKRRIGFHASRAGDLYRKAVDTMATIYGWRFRRGYGQVSWHP